MTRFRSYARMVVGRAWAETWRMAVPDSRKKVARDAVLFILLVGVLYVSGTRLEALGLIPEGDSPAMDSAISVAAGLIALALLFGAYLLVELLVLTPHRLWQDAVETPAPSYAPSQATYLKNVSLSAHLDGGVLPRVSADSVGTLERLEIGVQYMFKELMWQDVRRLIRIATVTDLIRDQHIMVELVSAVPSGVPGGRPRLFWGDPEDNWPLPYTPVRGRLVFVGPDGLEQYYYFTLSASDPNTNLFWHPFVLTPQEEIDWARKWPERL